MADNRFARTDNEIRRVFIQELTRTGFEKLTVSGLATKCLIDRSTFYAHFESVYELASATIDQYLAPLESQLKLSRKQMDTPGFSNYQFFNGQLVSYINANSSTIEQLRTISLSRNGFDARCRKIFADFYAQVFSLDTDSFTLYLLVNMAMSDLNYIIVHHHAPTLKEIQTGLQQITKMMN